MTSAVDPSPMSPVAAILYAITLPAALLAMLFGPVGRLDWAPGWVFIAVTAAGFGASAAVLRRVNPVIFQARSRIQAGTKGWDRVLLAIMLPAMVAEVPLATLDAGRMHWSQAPAWAVVAGYVALLAGIAGTGWAQAVNPFFEPGVRIQSERGQWVISGGPYRFVRHPGYSAAFGIFLGIPLALGSWWGLAPAAAAVGLLVLRTAFEDRLLRTELDGYREFAARTRYRLIPGLW